MCTDNAAMIAWAGVLRLQRQKGVGDGFDEPIMKKWPIDQC
jgi:N6-L-threonylcarbamoyladenine synthase